MSDSKVKAASVPEGKKQLKLADGGGMYLLVSPTGKYWCMDYRFADKRKTLSLGVYPTVSLKAARNKREDARKLLDQNIDPSQLPKPKGVHWKTYERLMEKLNTRTMCFVSKPCGGSIWWFE